MVNSLIAKEDLDSEMTVVRNEMAVSYTHLIQWILRLPP